MSQSLLLIIGYVLLAIAAAQFLWVIVRSRLSTKKESQSESSFSEQVEQACLNYHAQQKLTQGIWQDFREFTIVNKVNEGGEVYSYYLQPTDGQAFPSFLPGQYLTFDFTLPQQDQPHVRCYSLSDAPTQHDYYRISVKRILPTEHKPDVVEGLISNHLYHDMKVGDRLSAKAPAGTFTLDLDDTPIVLIAGGIGLTPLLSMVNTVYASGSQRTVHLFYAVINSSEHIMQKHLAMIAASCPNIHLHVFYAKPLAQDKLGSDYHHQGYLSVERIKEMLPSSNFIFYICGPAPMLNALFEGLSEWGVPLNDIRFEAFGPASIRVLNPEMNDESINHTVNYTVSDYECSWAPNEGTLLEFAENHGINLRSGCRAGRCGICMLKINKGQVKYVTTPQVNVPEGSCLPCVTTPCESLELEA